MAAQSNSYCATDGSHTGSNPAFNRSQFANCDFDVNYVKDNCYEVYVKVNVHFALETDCSGTTSSFDPNYQLQADDAFQAAENLVNSANTHLEIISLNDAKGHQAFWGAPETDAQCVPIRYVLNDVIIHCNSALRSLPLGSTQLINTDIQGPYPDALNVIIAQIPNTNGRTIDGYASPSGRYSVLKRITPDNFVHEIGHNLTLSHPHEGQNTLADGCADTYWYAPENWDGDGDGSIDEYNINVCWDTSPNPPGFIGDPCDFAANSNLVNKHPCCDWFHQYMNTMAHGSYKETTTYGAFTPCQMDRALSELSGPKCDLIVDINPGCPVPAAIIGNDPTRDVETECYFGLNLRASMSDDDFRVLVEMKDVNGNYVTYNGYSSFANNYSNWTSGPAFGYGIAVGYLSSNQLAHTLLLRDKEYRITLEVRNLCGDIAADIIEFTTNSACTQPRRIVAEEEVEVYPNPFWDGTQLTYETLESADIQIFTSGFNTSGTYEPPTLKAGASGQKEAGTYQVDFSNQELTNGINYIFIVADGVTYVKSVVKQ